MRMTIVTLAVFALMFLVPIVVYGVGSWLTGLPVPGGNPAAFLAGVAVTKVGTAVAFVGLWWLGRGAFGDTWLGYVGLWWVMFALGEAGQALGPDYSVQEAVLGLISETLYLPLSGLVVLRFLPA